MIEIKFIKEENILAQINASSVLEKRSYKVIKKFNGEWAVC